MPPAQACGQPFFSLLQNTNLRPTDRPAQAHTISMSFLKDVLQYFYSMSLTVVTFPVCIERAAIVPFPEAFKARSEPEDVNRAELELDFEP